MIFEQVRAGGDRNFAYIVADEKTKKSAIVDPSGNPDLLLSRSGELGLKIAYVINTHGHYDHTGGNEEILSKASATLVRGGAGGVEDGATFPLDDITLTIIHTPGHTEDGICILAVEEGKPGKLVTGDTLFVGKVGGTDFGAGARTEFDTLHQTILTLPDHIRVYPGHDYGVRPESTIGAERRENPFLLRKTFEEFLDLKRNWAAYKQAHGIA